MTQHDYRTLAAARTYARQLPATRGASWRREDWRRWQLRQAARWALRAKRVPVDKHMHSC